MSFAIINNNYQNITSSFLFGLDVPIDPIHKHLRTDESDSTTENGQCKTEHAHISKIKTELEKSFHLGFGSVKVERIQENIKSSTGR